MSGSETQHERAVYVDLEWNCWDGAKRSTEHQEIIEIGAVELDIQTLKVMQEKSYLIRPRPFDISQRCTMITGLSAEDLRSAPSFAEVMAQFEKDFTPKEKVCCTWGNDGDVLAVSCGRYKVRSPLRNCVDVAQLFWRSFLLRSQPSLQSAMDMMGLEFDGIAHTALADARNTARVHAAMIRRIRGVIDAVVVNAPSRDEEPRTMLFADKLSQALGTGRTGASTESSDS